VQAIASAIERNGILLGTGEYRRLLMLALENMVDSLCVADGDTHCKIKPGFILQWVSCHG
jgi:hypothetical protein